MQLPCNLESRNIETDDTGAFVQQPGRQRAKWEYWCEAVLLSLIHILQHLFLIVGNPKHPPRTLSARL